MYLGRENVIVIVTKYDVELFLPLLTKVAKLLMLSSGAKFENLETQVNSKDLFSTIATNAYTYKDLVSKEFISYHQYFVDADNYKCALSW
jgi:hypothetical protein